VTKSIELVTLATICHSFPSLHGPQVPRDNMIETMDMLFEAGTELIAIEGEEGIGKTTLLAQYALRKPYNCFSLFVKTTSRWVYDPDILKHDLFNQLNWLLRGEELKDEADYSDAAWRTNLIALRKRIRQRREAFYFIIDGLLDIPKDNSYAKDAILDLLPLGTPGCYFLFSGSLSQLQLTTGSVSTKPFPLPKFSMDESKKFFEGSNIDPDAIKELHQICNGIPSRLSSILRIILGGTSVQSLIDAMPEKLAELFELEWRQVADGSPELLTMLAVIAHDNRRHTVEDLSRLSGADSDAPQDQLKNLNFISTDDKSGETYFISEAFKNFAAKKLLNLKDSVQNILITDLLQSPESNISLSYLPDYLEQAGRFEEIITYLSPNNIAKMVEVSQSLAPVIQKSELGVYTALRLRRDSELIRFSVQKSIITALDNASVSRSEIEALMAMGEYDAALTLAQSNVLKEERLHLLAIIYRKKKEAGSFADEVLKEQIYGLYKQIDRSLLGERAVDIATDLIFCAPDLAIDLIERGTDTASGENALDWAIAKLAISAQASESDRSNDTKSKLSDTIERIRSRIRDPKAKAFSNSMAFLVNEYSSKQVISEVEKLDSTTEKLFLLRQWALTNYNNEDALEVTEYALRITIRTTDYAPNARVFREIAVPLSHASDHNKAKMLIGMLDSQRPLIEAVGPTEEFVWLALILALAESKYNSVAAGNRIIEAYYYIANITELEVRTTCLARLVVYLDRIDPDRTLEAKEGIYSIACSELNDNISSLLSNSAFQRTSTIAIIKVLARRKVRDAIELASKLNTEWRRDHAFLELLRSYLTNSTRYIDISIAQEIIAKIVDEDLRAEGVMNLIERLAGEENCGEDIVTKFLPLIDTISNLPDPRDRCRAYANIYGFLYQNGADRFKTLLAHTYTKLSVSWECIDAGWDKVNLGFIITEQLASYSKDLAESIYSSTEEFRKWILLENPGAAKLYTCCLQLTIKTFGGLLPKQLDQSADFDRLASLIDVIPSLHTRASLWADVALHYYLCGRKEKCTQLVNENICPLVDAISEQDKYCFSETLINVAPAIYCAHQRAALRYISKLADSQRDEACNAILNFIKFRVPPGEPCDDLGMQGYDLSYNQILEIIELIDYLYEDSSVYDFISTIIDTLCSRRYKDRFSAQQKSEVSRLINQIIDTNFPNPRFITHQGYKLISQAQVLRISNLRSDAWMPLIVEARQIPNASDKAYVLSIISVTLPSRDTTLQFQLFEEIKLLIKSIPITQDKIERFQSLATSTIDINNSISRECLRLAMEATIGNRSPEIDSSRKYIINQAYKLDPTFASSLASLVDNDPARLNYATKMGETIKTLDLKKKVADQTCFDEIKVGRLREEEILDASSKLLESLNAGRVNPLGFEHLRQFIQLVAKFPVHRSYTLLAWAVGNVVKKYSNTDQARRLIYPVFDALCLDVELARQLLTRSSGHLRIVRQSVTNIANQPSYIIKSGEREEAIQILKTWFQNEVKEYLIICDQFFGVEDLEILHLLLSAVEGCRVCILTSKKHKDQQVITDPIDEYYSTYWRLHISDQDPPNTEIIFVGTKSTGKSPIHDRWWLTKGSGLRLGSSYNSLGKNQTSDISILSAEDVEMRYLEIEPYLKKETKEHNGERLIYAAIYL
jgi:hypothetical protein